MNIVGDALQLKQRSVIIGTVGDVANTPYTMAKGIMSAGRIYENVIKV